MDINPWKKIEEERVDREYVSDLEFMNEAVNNLVHRIDEFDRMARWLNDSIEEADHMLTTISRKYGVGKPESIVELVDSAEGLGFDASKYSPPVRIAYGKPNNHDECLFSTVFSLKEMFDEDIFYTNLALSNLKDELEDIQQKIYEWFWNRRGSAGINE